MSETMPSGNACPGAGLAPAVAALRLVVDDLETRARALDDESVDWTSQAEIVLALERELERLGHVVGLVLSHADANGSAAIDGKRSMADWLESRTGQRRSVAGSRTWLATRLRSMPHTDEALAAGDITATHAQVLTRAQTPRTLERFAEDEAMLVAAARRLTADQLAKVVAHWLHHVDADGPEPVEHEDVFHLSMTMDGRLKGDFDLGGDLAIRAKAILDEATEQLRRQDREARRVDPNDGRAGERAAQRRARAFGNVLDRASISPANPARRQPLFNVHTTLDTLTGRGDPLEWKTEVDLAWKSAIPRTVLDRWTCDGEFARIVLDAAGHPLDVGRSQRLATPAQRRALIARYGGCATPGCHAHPGQVEIHHIEYWDDDGPTDLDNLIPSCSWCHHRIHDESLLLEMVDGEPVFSLPDGRILTEPRAGPSG